MGKKENGVGVCRNWFEKEKKRMAPLAGFLCGVVWCFEKRLMCI
jgi:hypothetical protein